jgi:hypothetical protein
MELAQEIIAYNTAKYLHDKLPQLKFLTNYENIDADKAEKYKKLRAYCEDHYLLTPFHSHYSGAYVRPLDALHTSLNKINEAQLALRSMTEDPESSEQILAYVKTILGLHDSIKSLQITGLDLYYVDLAQELLDYSLTIKDMLNYVSVLTEENKNIEQSTLDLIKLFIKTIKG